MMRLVVNSEHMLYALQELLPLNFCSESIRISILLEQVANPGQICLGAE